MYIPKSVIKKILKEAGAVRLSDDGLQLFHDSMNKIAFSKASRAVMLTKHRKGRTTNALDIKLAMNDR